MNWEDLTFNQFLEIQSIWEAKESELLDKMVAIIGVINGIDATKLSIPQYNEYVNKLNFLNQDVPKVPVKATYGDYDLTMDISNISMSQYIDFHNYSQSNDVVGVLSVFLIPKGHTYCDGYNINEVYNYIENMKVPDVLSIYSFFLSYSKQFMTIFQSYLGKKMKKTLKRIKRKRRKKLTRLTILHLYLRLLRRVIYRIMKRCKCLLEKLYSYFHTLLIKTKKN